MIFLGVPKQEVMESAPSDLWCYEDAFKLRRKHIDEVSYAMGIYTYEAVGIAVGNAFRGKGQRAMEYLKQPLIHHNSINHLLFDLNFVIQFLNLLHYYYNTWN